MYAKNLATWRFFGNERKTFSGSLRKCEKFIKLHFDGKIEVLGPML
jgi:hypothetical protein